MNFDLSSNNLIKIKFNINFFELNSLVDTGASSNFISKNVFDKQENLFGSKKQFLVESVKVKIGDSSITHCNYSIYLPLELNGSYFRTLSERKFTYVSENLSFDVILGMSFKRIPSFHQFG